MNAKPMMKKLTAEDPGTKSADVVADNIARLKELFPEAFTEGRVDFDVLKQILGGAVDEREEKFGLNWYGKRQARQIALAPSTGTLRPCPEESVNWDTTQNLMIEGDNLEVLKLLQKSYAGKVKLIYIDPPYNTGRDFVYPDDFRDNIRNYLVLTGQTEEGRRLSSNTESSGRFHTNWLNMMYPRLKLARSLLREDGIIFVSIDDAEIANLREVLCDVFGEENFVVNLVWERGRKNDARRFSTGHEYIVGFAKNLAHVEELLPAWREPKEGVAEIVAEYRNLRAKHGDDHAAVSAGLVAFYQGLPDEHPSKKYSRSRFVDARGIWRDNNISWPGGGGPRYDLLHPVTGKPCKVPDDGWRFVEETMRAKVRDGYVEFREDDSKSPFLKSYLYVDAAEATSSDEDSPGEKLQVMGSVFYRHSQPANDVFKSLFGEKVFENPKDHVVLARLIRYCAGPSDIVMDFFAGSGSTAHAVVDLNRADAGSRRFVLVQLPEPLDAEVKEQALAAKFCDTIGRPRRLSEITKERLRRVLTLERQGGELGWGGGFRVFKLASSNFRAWEPNPSKLAQTLEESVEHLKTDRTERDVLYEVLLKLGLDLCVPIESIEVAGAQVYSVGGGVLLACLAEKVTKDKVIPLAEGIAAWHQALKPVGDTTCIFRDSAFADDVAKTNLAAILHQSGLSNVRSL